METDVGEDWRAREQDLDAIAAARNADPFAVLGPHRTPAGWVIRVFAPEAISRARAHPRWRAHRRAAAAQGRLFRGAGPVGQGAASLSGRGDNRAWVVFVHGLLRVRAGAWGRSTIISRERARIASSTAGLAPSSSVTRASTACCLRSGRPTRRAFPSSVEFNQWDGRRCQMRRRFDSGLWEIFVPELTVGACL